VEEPQDAWISGQVTVEGEGLAGVDVTLTGPDSRSASTDALGAFDFSQLHRGTYTLTLAGYDSELQSFPVTHQTVTANDGGKVEVQFQGTWVPQPPAAPADLAATATGAESIDLTWTDGSDDETGFRVERKDGAEGTWSEIAGTAADSTTFTDTGLAPLATYTYRVRACNDDGCSEYTAEASATTEDVPPGAPTELTAGADGPDTIHLSWSDGADNETGFQVERRRGADSAWSQVAAPAADSTTFSDTGLSPATTYTYRVRACNEAGCSAFSDEAGATTEDVPPEAPSGLQAEADGPTAVQLTWTDASGNEDEFQVERKEGAAESWSRVKTAGADAEGWTDTGLTSLTSYTYRIRACNAMGCSPFSNEATATTTDLPPDAPTGLSATATGQSTIELSWTDESDNETGFRVERRKESGGSWSTVATRGPNTESLQDSGLSASTAYLYRVRACNEAGCSDFSNEAGATTDGIDGPNLFIESLYITQSTQTPGGQVPLVADKDGYLRVFVQADEANDFAPDVRVRFYLGGSLAYTATIPSPGSSVPTSVYESSLGYSWNLPVPASLIQPGLSVLAEVDPDNGIPEADEGDNTFPTGGSPGALDVRSTAEFQVTFVPVRQSVNDLTGNVTAGNAADFFDTVLEMLPVAHADGNVHAVYTTDAEALVNDNANGAWGAILTEMYALKVGESSSRHYFGVVKTTYTSGVAGMGYLGWPAAVGWDRLPSGAGVAAHEWGHNWNRAHAPGCGAANPDAGYPYADGKIGVWGMNVGSAALKSPSTYYDFMSYCGPDWISDYSYEAILEYRQAQAAWGTPAAAPEPSLLVWGRVEEDRIVLEPAFRITTQPTLPAGPGAYTLEGTAADGTVLFNLAFEPMPVPDGLPGEGHFAFAVPLRGFDAHRLTGIQVRGGSRTSARLESAVGPALAAPPESSLAVEPLGPSGAVIRWNAGTYPMALVRDPATGEILSFARGGRVELAVPAGEVEVTLSDGVRSSTPIRRSVR